MREIRYSTLRAFLWSLSLGLTIVGVLLPAVAGPSAGADFCYIGGGLGCLLLLITCKEGS